MNKLLTSAALAIGLGISAASASTITNALGDCASDAGDAFSTLTGSCGSSTGSVNRTLIGNVELGAATGGDFFSLGQGGSAIFEVAPSFTGPLSVVEVTFGNPGNQPESANVFVRMAGSVGLDLSDFMLVGSVNNLDGGGSLSVSGVFDAIAFVDTSTSPDGFDLAAFDVAPVPLPATALLLLGGLAGFGALRRRKTA